MNTRLVPSTPATPKLFFSNSNVMREQSVSMGSHFYPLQQNNLWDELKQSISISKQLSDVYLSSVKDHKPDSTEMLMAFKKSNEKTHVALETFLNSFIAQKYDDGHNKASDIEIRHDQTQVSAPRIPQYQPISCSQERMPSSEGELRSETKTQYPCKTEFRPQSENLNRSLSNSHIPTQSRNIYWSSSDSPNMTQYEVRNKSRSKSQDQHEFGTRSMYSSMTRHQPRSRNLNMSPSNYRNQKKPGRRNRSRSRSYNGHRFGSRSTYSSKNRQRSQSRNRKKSKSKSLDRRDNVTEHQPLYKPKHDRSLRASRHKKFKNEIGQGHPPKNTKKGKQFKSTQSTSSSDTSSQLEEEPPIPVVNSGTTVIPPSQGAPQVQNPFYSHNVTPMYYAQPTHMPPRLMPVPYYMPPRSRLPYPPTYPRLLYRPQWQPAVCNYGTQ
ncbi:pre-mRNA-splicing factor CWC22 homolog [Metopolophium dirhodum]|uniref:pre-mRNA-splicing factor CWC22 homolog n=1 Tax=Metopolophium dirhodum TaxID=44670 RepID=UPI0029907463|nr:pre-mRNA-splicing factor CWC22 homolog [Metopolophium dirhodum]